MKMDDGSYGREDEDQLVRMVQEFMESDSSSEDVLFSPQSQSESMPPHHHHLHPTYFALRDILESETEIEAEVLESVMRHMRRRNNSCHCSGTVKRWLVRKLKMEGYKASLCHTCWVTSLRCPGGDYEYVEVLVTRNDSSWSSSRLIVDVDFRSQFELARPTPAYRQLTEVLPRIFIGDEKKLEGIVSLICSAAKRSLRERGLHIPPWRTAAYMMSKWLSSDLRKEPVSTVSSSSSSKDKRDCVVDGDDPKDILVARKGIVLM